MSEVLVNGKPISSLRVVDLKEELEKRGLSKNGRKDELAQRLQSFLEVNPENKEDLNDDDTIDVIEASRLQAEKQRQDEEQREAKRKQEECARRERELQELRELVGVSPTREEQNNLEEQQRHAEQQKRAEAERVEELRRQEEEKERIRKEQERKQKEEAERLRLEEERKEKIRLQKAEEERQEQLRLEAIKKKEEEKRRKAEEEERLKQEEETRRKEVQRKLEEEQKKINEEKARLEAIQKEEERKRREEDEERKHKEEQKWLEEERKKEEALRKQEEELEQAKEKKVEEETASIREESRLKEKLLQRLREDKAKKAEDSINTEDNTEKEKKAEAKEDKESENKKEEASGEEGGKEGGGEEGGGDDTLVMEIDQSDLVLAVEQPPEDKQHQEKPLPTVKPGEVKPLRRLGSHKGDTPGTSEKRKRGWGASRTSRQDSSENIDVSSNSLKDIVPDPSNLLTKLAAGVELDEVAEEDDDLENGHNTNKNGDQSDEEIGPSLPKQKKIIDKPVRKQIVLDDNAGEEESDTILILNLVRPFTPHQLKEMLKRTGTILDFWLNRIKSKCCVQFSSQAEASETRMALNGVTWPIDNKNPLRVVFTTAENMEKLKTSADEAAERLVVSNGARSGIIPVRDWDKDRLPGSQQKRRSSSPSRGDRRSKQETPPPPVQTKSLEQLFKKTKALPALYWKPLSSEVIAKKEEARNRRVLAAVAGGGGKSKSRRSRSRS